MKFLAVLSLFFIAASAIPAELDQTKIQVEEGFKDQDEVFSVIVERKEDIVGPNDQVIDERLIQVSLLLDVSPSLEVTVNGVKAPYGLSEIEIAASISEVSETAASVFPTEVKVKVQIFVALAGVEENGVDKHQVTIRERVIGIEGGRVWQAKVQEQVFDVHANGEVKRYEVREVEALEFLTGGSQDEEFLQSQLANKEHHHPHEGHPGHPGNPEHPEHQGPDHPPKESCKAKWHALKTRFMTWFDNLSFPLRLIVSFAIGVSIGVVLFGFLRCLVRCCCRKRKCCQHNGKNQYNCNLQLQSTKYTPLPSDDKDAKKEPVSAIV